MEQAGKILKDVFGYDQFRGAQLDIIQALSSGQDVLALMPTGGGKSLCYQIPALMRSGTGIIISPLIALMHDQVKALKQLGVKAAFLNSSQSLQEQDAVKQDLFQGQLDLLYVAPERLFASATMGLLQQVDLALFAIDEVHCVSQWGHDFRPEYRQLRQLVELFPHVPRIALTATADQKTRQDIVEQLSLSQAVQFVDSFNRPNICYTIAEEGQAREQLWRFLQDNHPEDAGIVYCLSRKKTEDVAAWLRDRGREALAYHAGLSAEQRAANQNRFLHEDGVIVVATVAFGMGIDKPDVRFVAHLNMPKSIEAYAQETGRAGRDGEPANAWLSYALRDAITYQQWINDSGAPEEQKIVERQKLDSLLALFEATQCRRQHLLGYFGETLEHPCGNCDNCLSPPQTIDGLEAAQKALSTVYRTGQRFGIAYLIKVLLGKEDERIIANRHDSISMFGIGTEFSNKQWRAVFRQLLAQGYLVAEKEGFGGVMLSDQCRPLLKGDVGFTLRCPPEAALRKVKTKEKSFAVSVADRPLWEALVALRLRLSNTHNVPPYVICHNRTLFELVQKRPSSLEALHDISGLAAKKIERYGADFLQVIGQIEANPLLVNKLSDTVNESLLLFDQGNGVEEIAEQRDLQASTIYGHLAEAIEAGVIELGAIETLDEHAISEILETFEAQNALETNQLKPSFDALDGRYDYGLLKCVLADCMYEV